jgi:hypothetical protein
MTETIFTGEQIKKFPFDDIFTLIATLRTIFFISEKISSCVIVQEIQATGTEV